MSKRKPAGEDLLETLKRGVLEVIRNPKAEPSEKLKAIEVGAKLLAIERKLNSDHEPESFFK